MKVAGLLYSAPPMRMVGGELCTLRLLHATQQAGHEVVVVVQTLRAETSWNGLRLIPGNQGTQHLRAAHVVVSHPDVPNRRSVARHQREVLVVHNTEETTIRKAVWTEASLVATSQHTAQALAARGVKQPVTVVRPPAAGWVQPAQGARRYAALVVSTSPAKGGDIVQACVDAHPRVPVLVVRGGHGEQLNIDGPSVGVLGHGPMNVPLALAKVMLAPSRSETYGMAVAEAVHAGVPVVASDLAAHREVLGDDWPALLPAGDQAAWVAGLGRWWRDAKPLQQATVARGRALAGLEAEAVADWLGVLSGAPRAAVA